MSSQYSPPTPEAYEDKWVTIKKSLLILAGAVEDGSLSGGGGLPIPSGQTDIQITYVGATNNIDTVTYQPSGYTLTMTYAGGGAADNDLLTNVSGA